MSISAQLPSIALTLTSSSVQTLALAAGGTVDAKVLGQQANGTTQVQIGGQVMNLQLPSPPSLGATLTLAVQQVEGQLSLTLVSTKPAASGSIAAASAQAVNAGNPPATQVHISAAALSGVTQQAQTSAAAPPPVSAQPSQSSTQPNGAMPQSQAPVVTQVTSAVVATPQQAAAGPLTAPSAAPSPATQQSNPGVLPQAVPAPTGIAGAPAASGMPRAIIPYAVAAPAVAPPTSPLPHTIPAPAVDAPVGRALAAGTVGQRAPSTETSPQGRPAMSPMAPQPVTTQAVLSHMVQRSLPGQDSIVGLTTALAKVIGRTALPEPVVKAALAVLSQRLAVDGGKLDGAMIQRAVLNSGLFQEAQLAAGQPKAAGGDLKTALLSLQRGIGAWLGDQAPVEKVSSLPPPLRGVIPRARAGDAQFSNMPEDPVEAGKVLLERTEAALSRLRLHQHASLPEAGQRQEAQWSLDLPVTIGGQQNVLQMQIHRDPEAAQTAPEERGWQVRFAINLGEPGEVGAQISLRGLATGVLVWADHADTATLLDQGVGELRQELEAVGLHVGSVLIRSGAPMMQAAPAAHFLDETR